MARFKPFSTAPEPERAILVGVETRNSSWPCEKSLDELERLASTAGAVTYARLTQKLDKPIPRSFIGSGKVAELKSLVDQLHIDIVIFDDNLSPSQQSYLEKAVGEPVKILDRTALILDIFGQHARTKEGRLQVQLAQLQYLLPRLRGMWSHLAKEQTRGGIGSRFGQGESQLEVDRRLIRNKISSLKSQIDEVEKRRSTQSKARNLSPAFRIALAGYTNAGKSSLLNAVTGASVHAEDKLFATLDPTTRNLVLPGCREVTVTDTVGFIRKLPHGLVDAFKSTLSEVLDSDLILLVVDISDADASFQIEAVMDVLKQIGADNKPMITVLNKVDLLGDAKRKSISARYPDAILFSASTGFGLASLLDRLTLEASSQDVLMQLKIPYRDGAAIDQIHRYAQIITEEYADCGYIVLAKLPRFLSNAYGNMYEYDADTID